MTDSRSARAWLLLLLLTLIWGSSFILIKKGLAGMSPLDVGALRMFSAGLVLSPFAFGRIWRVPKAQIKYLVMVGLSGSFVPSFLFAVAQTQIPSGLTGVLNAVTPIFTVLIGLIFFQQTVAPKTYLGVGIGFLGSAILISSGNGGTFSGINLYALLIIGATICYCINSNVIKYKLQDLSALSITSISLAFGGVAALIYFVFFSDYFSQISEKQVLIASGYVVFLGVAGTAIALILFNKLVQITDPVFTSSVTYLIPIVAVIWGILDGEKLSVIHLAGIVLILGGVYLTNRLKRN